MSQLNSTIEDTLFGFENRDRKMGEKNKDIINSLDLNLIIDVIDNRFSQMYDRPLGTAEILILEGIWHNKLMG